MLKVFTKKRFWKKLCTVLLCFVLCFTLVLNSVVDVFANPIAVGLFELILAILAACGITFGTVALAHDGVDAFTSGASSGVTDLLNAKLAEITTLAATAGVVYTIGINFLSEQWQMITADVVRIFGDYKGVDALINCPSTGVLKVGDTFKTTAPGCSLGSCVSVKIGNMTANYIGAKSAKTSLIPQSVLDCGDGSVYDDTIYIIQTLPVADLVFANTINNLTDGSSYDFSDTISFLPADDNVCGIDYNVLSASVLELGYTGWPWSISYAGRQIYKDYISYADGTFKLKYADTAADVIVNGKLGDYTFGKSVCPDGIWTNKTWYDWINELIFGDGIGAVSGSNVGALPGDAGIDTTAYPGNDTWHDGIDDVATGSPSIGISVPTDVSDDDIATLNPSKARDYSNADVKDKDTTGDNDKPGDKDDDKKPSSKPSGLPSMTLPEILFKNKFPFCLPWDLYSLFVSLNATPKAPKFTIPFKNSRLNIDYEITIDISDYEMFAKLSRASLSVVFVVALILLSRKLIGAE